MKSILMIVAANLILGTSIAFGKIQIKRLDFKALKTKGVISVEYSGHLNDYPELTVTGKSIQVLIPNSSVKNAIEKSVSVSSHLKDTQLRAYQTTKSDSKIKALLPYSIEKKSDQVALTVKDNKIELTFPRVKMNLKKSSVKNKKTKKKAKSAAVKKEFLNESYLNNLLKIDKKKEKKAPKKIIAKKIPTKVKKEQNDQVTATLAAPMREAKTSKSSFSLIEYGGKFVAFLGFVLLLFYGVMALMKKGFIRKGKLGFLNNTETISVINQTYIAPKKSLMLVKAHNQVFLVSNTDAGIHPISEINDVAGLFKEGEKAISGTNFDTKLTSANLDEKIEQKVKIKEDISESNQASSLSSYVAVKDKVKFSDQIRKKAKNLKSLQ